MLLSRVEYCANRCWTTKATDLVLWNSYRKSSRARKPKSQCSFLLLPKSETRAFYAECSDGIALTRPVWVESFLEKKCWPIRGRSNQSNFWLTLKLPSLLLLAYPTSLLLERRLRKFNQGETCQRLRKRCGLFGRMDKECIGRRERRIIFPFKLWVCAWRFGDWRGNLEFW